MSTTSERPTIHELLNRLAELEQAHARLQEELTNVRAERVPAEEQTSTQTRPRPRRSSRRKVLEKGLGVAVATVGVGTLLELSSGTALAASTPKPGVFASSVAGTPAVKATGTNGADGVDATSDSGTGVSATSSSGTGLVATSSSGLAGHFMGNVKLDNALTVVGALSSGAGALASSVAITPAVSATGTNGADGVDGTSDSGTGVFASSNSGTGVRGGSNSVGGDGLSPSGVGVRGTSVGGDGVRGTTSNIFFSVAGVHGINTNGISSGLAGLFDGTVQVNGNFSASGTKAFVQAHPTDPSREIVYVALEEAKRGRMCEAPASSRAAKRCWRCLSISGSSLPPKA